MIPKIIHYCWFSYPPDYPPDVLKCFASWKKFLPDYEIKLWNAKNFDLSVCPYAMEAYNERKFAFASDYVRLRVLYDYGGIYFDSDIEVLRSFDDLLDDEAFTGFEDKGRIAAWIFGSEKGNPIFKEFLDYYNGRHFILGRGYYDTTPNPVPITKTLMKHGLTSDNKIQRLEHITVYPMEYFCPFNPYRKGYDCFTENTYANHHFNGAWKILNECEEQFRKDSERYMKFFGRRIGFLFARFKHAGFFKTTAEILKKRFSRLTGKKAEEE